MNIGWPQALYLALLLIGLGIAISKHGEMKKPERHKAGTTFVASMLVVLLLYWGGFFAGASP
ncbi:hypothetical protein ABFU65_12010 [Xanthomonas campestris pv. raphani]|uniref:hypothetical protein n=1 Tax=Xanthomonas campestris TaxID=339 RepID=UPI002B2304B2|nr:hypothetical protein [Xanthomonas campestris]MEB1134227.1 hypothetical protein [Xanthomonas campestris pv. campestris]MEA9551732.1 hypothetical protein [Xanthomonas campestris]MEA9653079.1 hypothetical protein [Xanthomonas campestris pv. raphani]MEB1653853.1 hypothetical protein [Xanthomonas campestris pv. campestris]MEB1863564.1 hypothetical protein [Xanthomonas campestris pv. campestris]